MSPESQKYTPEVKVKKPPQANKYETYPRNWGTTTNNKMAATHFWRK